MKVLVTGGAGYIGSHTVRALLGEGHQVVIVDNLIKGHREAIPSEAIFVEGDIKNQELLINVMDKYDINGIIHLAAHSLVGESMEKPGKYYFNNFCNGIGLLEAMIKCEVKNIVFSSTAAVYGEPEEIPINEEHTVNPTNVYGESKLFFEKSLERYSDIYDINYFSLRYFNAAGADPSGEIGEAHDPETHLIPIVLQKVIGERDEFYIFGDEYNTRDGSCIRDYIHVNDLADAHILALKALADGKESEVFNLGNGQGYSVKEVVKKVEEVTDKKIEAEIGQPRPGDPAKLVASAEKIKRELGWNPCYPELETIIKTAWEWHKGNEFD